MASVVEEQGAPQVRAESAADFLREQHRRLFGVLRALAATRDPDERVEIAAALGDELEQLLALERGVVLPTLEGWAESRADPPVEDAAAGARRARLAALAEQVTRAAEGGEITKALLDEVYALAAEHVNETIRLVLPHLERLPAPAAARMEAHLRDLKERLAEH